MFCLCFLLVSCFQGNLISILLKIPVVDRPCLALAPAMQGKKKVHTLHMSKPVSSATEWTASVPPLHMSQPVTRVQSATELDCSVMLSVFKVPHDQTCNVPCVSSVAPQLVSS